MKTYISFSDEQKERARNTNLADFLRQQGEALTRSGSEYLWKHNGCNVTIRGSVWYDQYQRVGGSAIDFVKRFYGKNYAEAVTFLLGEGESYAPTMPLVRPEKRKELVMPERFKNSYRVFNYLMNERGIDPEVIVAFMKRGMIYETEKFHNAAFVGMDKDGLPRHVNLRGIIPGSQYKKNAPGSDPRFSFNWRGPLGSLYLFEAPIDMMSYISMHPNNWQDNCYAACCGVSDQVLFQILETLPGILRIALCLDNDGPGQEATKRIADKFRDRGIDVEVAVPINKDWNEDLLQSIMEGEQCPGFRL